MLHGRLDPEAGALLERVLDAAQLALFGMSERKVIEEAVEPATSAQRRADALGLIAETALPSETVATGLCETAHYGGCAAGHSRRIQ